MSNILLAFNKRINNLIHNQKGATDAVLITIISIFVGITIMFIIPIMAVSQQNDTIAQTTAQEATTQFVSTIANSGSITQNDYDTYVQKLSSTGNSFDISIEVQHLDENPGKKSATTSGDLIGENVYYSTYTSEIMDYMSKQRKLSFK